MAIVLYDNEKRKQLFPLTATRAVADLLTGIYTIKQKWQLLLNAEVYVATESYLQTLYDVIPGGVHYWVDATVLPTQELINAILVLQNDEALKDKQGLVACKAALQEDNYLQQLQSKVFTIKNYENNVLRIEFCFDLFKNNSNEINNDFLLATKNKTSQNISSTNHLTNADNIFIEGGAVVEGCFLNASEGAIYIGKNALLMEGTCIRGPAAILENAVIKMGAKIYGGTTIGKHCTAGGEIKNAIIMNYSNKAHDGYLGDSVIGEWCNLGAGTSVSNIKNTAGEVMLYNYASLSYINSGKKCGVIMGDYSRTAINTSINTGSVIGICCNVFGNEPLQKFIHDFSWGAMHRYIINKALEHISNWKKLKQQDLSEKDSLVLKHIFEQTETQQL